jgi:hypothetical protein
VLDVGGDFMGFLIPLGLVVAFLALIVAGMYIGWRKGTAERLSR